MTGEITYGRIPAGSVVVSGNLPSSDGKYSLYCAVIIKQVDEKTRSKTGNQRTAPRLGVRHSRPGRLRPGFLFHLIHSSFMSENLSNNAIIYAFAVFEQRNHPAERISGFRGCARRRNRQREDILDDLEQAFMEFVDVYKSRCRADKSLPDLDELLNSQL